MAMKEHIKSRALKLFWIALTGGITIFTLIVSVRTIGDMMATSRSTDAVELKIEEYSSQIEADSLFIEQLNTPEFLERYAREEFNMQRAGETVYIME